VSERIEQLRQAVEKMPHFKGSHEDPTRILETFRRQKIREGEIESFALSDHPKVKRCYARSFQDNAETQCATAPGIAPVESPITAIVADAKWKK
jgi:hypothetical protein